MNVLLISQCDKRALTETRRILDQFAERRGDRTWQTPITREGLATLHRLLRKTARRNTAVACHWIRGADNSELLWTVGDRRRFNRWGAVPTNTTTRNVVRADAEDGWHTAEAIHLLSRMAALLHDLGKASEAFQARLAGAEQARNAYRHEWVSLRLFEAFVGADDDRAWLARLAAPTPDDDRRWIERLQRDGFDEAPRKPFAALSNAPLAQAIAWLVVTHHRLPVLPPGEVFQGAWLHDTLARIDAGWNETPGTHERHAIEPYWRFPHGLPVTTEAWRQRAARLAHRLLARLDRDSTVDWRDNPFVMHLSRLCLMLADHHYSSLTGADPGRITVPAGYPLYANTTGRPGAYNQTLDEHLIGVAQHAGAVSHALPRFDRHLPRLARHRALTRRARDERFRWQDRASDLAATMRERAARHGAFIVNLASTGCGKTLGNARVMHALADPAQGMRCTFAMGLRTLTLQTGRAFRELLGVSDDELAVRVGGAASRALFEHFEQQAEASGSASRQSLLEEDAHVVFEAGTEDDPLLQRVMRNPQVRALLVAPLLVCTIDHLAPATESQRGGRQIAPMLRLMSSDLVLDEPDDFGVEDLPALTRLVHWAGLLGARVLLSSATLPPTLVQGLFDAYLAGRRHFDRNRGESAAPAGAAARTSVCCAWVDEFAQQRDDCDSATGFAAAHDAFVARRCEQLGREAARRRCEMRALPLGGIERARLAERFAALARDAALELHQRHHGVDPRTGRAVSFGLVRMANIEPLVDVALALYRLGSPPGIRIHLCVYHAQFPLLVRSAIERELDSVLDRRQPEAVFEQPGVRERLDAGDEPQHLFIVLGSPVTEVGRDHDYDWAVVEPSSMRSLVQLAGRVRRHRPGACATPNIVVFETNLRHFRNPGAPAFCRPGFETSQRLLASHRLGELWPEHVDQVLDARPRIAAPAPERLQPRHRLVDLEHACLRDVMLASASAPCESSRPGLRRRGSAATSAPPPNAASWWHLAPRDALLTALLPQHQPFRRDGMSRVDLLLRPDATDEDRLELVRLEPLSRRRRGETLAVVVERSQHRRVDDAAVVGTGIAPWAAVTDEAAYRRALRALAEALDLAIDECARRFGCVSVVDSEAGWRFHPTLGFSRFRQGEQ